jgi:hypothetical protein
VFRPVPLALNTALVRAAVFILIASALFALTALPAGATEPTVSTPTAWQYAYEMAPTTERQPETSTPADFRLAFIMMIAAMVGMASVLLSDKELRGVDAREAAVQTTPTPLRSAPAKVHEPVGTLPEAA